MLPCVLLPVLRGTGAHPHLDWYHAGPCPLLITGKGVAQTEQQEAALEGVLDLCRQPGFVHDIFVNCDCRCVFLVAFSFALRAG